MSTTKIVLWVVVALVVIGAIWYFWSQYQDSSSMMQQTTPATTPTGTTSTQTSDTQPAVSNGDSNADLNADLNAIDTQTNSANSDSAAVDQSFNDQPVQQSQL